MQWVLQIFFEINEKSNIKVKDRNLGLLHFYFSTVNNYPYTRYGNGCFCNIRCENNFPCVLEAENDLF